MFLRVLIIFEVLALLPTKVILRLNTGLHYNVKNGNDSGTYIGRTTCDQHKPHRGRTHDASIMQLRKTLQCFVCRRIINWHSLNFCRQPCKIGWQKGVVMRRIWLSSILQLWKQRHQSFKSCNKNWWTLQWTNIVFKLVQIFFVNWAISLLYHKRVNWKNVTLATQTCFVDAAREKENLESGVVERSLQQVKVEGPKDSSHSQCPLHPILHHRLVKIS